MLITHPDYSHISPSANGIYAETPIWLVTGDPRSGDDVASVPTEPPQAGTESYLSKLPIVGEVIELGDKPIYADLVTAQSTSEERPTVEAKRMATF